MIILNWVVQIH